MKSRRSDRWIGAHLPPVTSAIFTKVFVCSGVGALLLFKVCSKFALLNQARLDLRDPRCGLTQRLDAGMHGVGAQDKGVIMRHSRAKDELCVGFGLEFDHGARRLESHQFALPQLVWDHNGTLPQSSPEDSVPGGWLVAPAFSSL